jgi:hypothetical protein
MIDGRRRHLWRLRQSDVAATRGTREGRRAPAIVDRLTAVVWPAFLIACALEFLVFAIVDPAPIDPFATVTVFRTAVYTVTFFVLWLVVAGVAFATGFFEE